MIISFEPDKDTYVTNRQTKYNDGLKANTGQASTIDIFKLYNENENKNSEFEIIFNSIPNENEVFKIKDVYDNEVEFIFSSNKENIADNYGNVKNGTSYIEIGLGLTGSEYSLSTLLPHIVGIINNVKNNTSNNLTLNITASILEDKILLTQDKPGSIGDTYFSGSYTSIDNKTFEDGYFKRVEYSCGLVSFDLEKIKETYVQNSFSNSVFSNKSNFKATIKFKDVGNFQSTPADVTLKLYPLLKSFEEGLGRDIIYFSDVDTCNFIKLDDKNNIFWHNKGKISFENDVTASLSNQSVSSSFYLKNGNEDLEFDITEYLFQYFSGSHSLNNGFLLTISQDNLNDNYSYFVKRLGTRHLKNKLNTPELLLKIKDTALQTYRREEAKYYLDKNENLFLFNDSLNFESDKDVIAELSYLSGSTNVLENGNFDHVITGSDLYDLKGEKLNNVKKFEISHPFLSIFSENDFIRNQIDLNDKLDVKIRYFYKYNNTEYDIKETTKSFYSSQYSEERAYSRIRFSLLEKDLVKFEEDEEINLSVFFYDLDKQYLANKEKVSLTCLDLGNITYSVYDVDTDELIIEKQEGYTDLQYDGDIYLLRLFITKKFVNRRISFILHYVDPYTNQNKTLKDKDVFIRL